MFKLGKGNNLGKLEYPTSDMVLGLKGQRSVLGLELTAIGRGFELYECFLCTLPEAFSSYMIPKFSSFF